ncbi:hypothetical protein A2761_02095 [Candidatus Kaiserbacteria bacterium RIFCSPHIGHO2_01_FULL_51_33]|uniref:Thioredoxin domain-containing protein n=1 Tax=Candidatus Kaiserbacteria bacterium RIFCSPLOWO2_01_FULL_51_21 TaxID=1798508 RepID=A0A1F6ECV1_9BACT|nr:MAG: hypothetical protein A2761_02095 [Candidatus Kaiserbacteria bacterium RIFCSPHIGHO2_01_FULL_51_33]OGG71499.1 MAG: hypothetical protein A3A35_02070 [Candidatus Kaiserbacteria bacterium RIFCSPLOWO2_01_FULL_51_21]
MKTSTLLAVIVGLIVLGSLGYWAYYQSTPGPLDEFTQCLKDKGTIFYGAFWCPHCQAQKKLFGKSVKLLPYTECSTPNGKGQLKVCTDAGVQGYPTWVFPDGTRATGEVPLQTLSTKTSCALPEGIAPGAPLSGGSSEASTSTTP